MHRVCSVLTLLNNVHELGRLMGYFDANVHTYNGVLYEPLITGKSGNAATQPLQRGVAAEFGKNRTLRFSAAA